MEGNAPLFKSDELKKDTYDGLIAKIMDKYGIKEKYKEYYFESFVSGIGALISKWLTNGCDLEVQEVANLIKKIVTKAN